MATIGEKTEEVMEIVIDENNPMTNDEKQEYQGGDE